jgi:signal peptidase I
MNQSGIIKSFIKKSSFSVKATGYSMQPILTPKDLLFFKKNSFSNIQINDIIIVKKSDKYLVHRVIYKNSKYLVTKGDNNPYTDGEIKPHQIIGKLFKIQRNNRELHPDTIYLIQSTQYLKEIIKIKNEFEKKGIDYLFLKGLPLHLYYEKKIPRRLYADCDILVNQKQITLIRKILLNNAYVETNNLLTNFHSKFKKIDTQIVFFKKTRHFSIIFDIHILPIFLSNQLGYLNSLYPTEITKQIPNEFLKNKIKINIADNIFYILNSSDLIIFLCFHFFHHNYKSITQLYFIYNVINELSQKNNSKLLWNNVFLKLKKYKLINYLYPVFICLKKYFNIKYPKNFISSIKPKSKIINWYYQKVIFKNMNVFTVENRISGGMNKFMNLFFLSDEKFSKKIFIFFNPLIIFSIFFVFYVKFKSIFKKYRYKNNYIY